MDYEIANKEMKEGEQGPAGVWGAEIAVVSGRPCGPLVGLN